MDLMESKAAILRLISSRNGSITTFEGIEGFCDEDHFNEMFDLERKRTRRSQKPFILILINIACLVKTYSTDVLNKLEKALAFPIRETDFRGWYMQGSVIGIVFTELNSVGRQTRESLFGKILSALTSRMEPDVLRKVYVTFYTFPVDHEDAVSCGRFDFERYVDCTSAAQRFGV